MPLVASTRVCAGCKVDLPLAAYDGPECMRCSSCASAEAARREARKRRKPADYVTPGPGGVPLKRCEACGAEKVWAAFPSGSDVCRACTAGEQAPAPKPEANPEGKRPVEYTPELGAAVCERIAAREPLYKVCAEPSMPTERMVSRWRARHREFAAAYEAARVARADSRADMIDRYLDEVRSGTLDPHQAKVLIDGERWPASREQPARYGDKVQADLTSGGVPLQAGSLELAKALLQVLPALALPAPAEEETIEVEANEPHEHH